MLLAVRRCMMHCFNTCMAAILGHSFPEQLIKRAQSVVTYFRASHKPLAELKKAAKTMGITRLLVTSNQTRFTSVHAMLESVVRVKPALDAVVAQFPQLVTSKAVTEALADDLFVPALKQLCQLLVPFTLVIHAIQSDQATLADVTRYWMFLARSMSEIKTYITEPSFKQHCISTFNMKEKDMFNPLAQLALFLHPWYREVASKGAMYEEVRRAAANVWKNNGKSKDECKAVSTSAFGLTLQNVLQSLVSSSSRNLQSCYNPFFMCLCAPCTEFRAATVVLRLSSGLFCSCWVRSPSTGLAASPIWAPWLLVILQV